MPHLHVSTATNWLALIQAEYREMPGLSLTATQVEKLWNLDTAAAGMLLRELQDTQFLRMTPRGTYVRTDVGRT